MPSAGRRLTLQQKEALRDMHRAQQRGQMNLGQMCNWANQEFGFLVHKSTMARILQDGRATQNFSIADAATIIRCNLKLPKYPELDEQLSQWVDTANTNNVCITGPMLKQKALRLAADLGIGPSFRASQGCLHKFQRRHNFWVHRLHGQSASVDTKAATNGRNVVMLETQMYNPSDIYNMDETAIFYKAQPKTSISSERLHGLKKDKSRLSVALPPNANGSHKLPPVFIGKAARPRCFGSLSTQALSLYYRSNRKAWMTIAIFSEWIMKLNDEMARQNRHVLLLLDNASSHQVVRADINNVRVLMLPPNTTSVLQPMDAGIIATFKNYYRRRQLDYAIQIVDEIAAGGVVSDNQKKNPYAVDVLQAMLWSSEAWDEVSASTIRNCWAHTGILPRMSLIGALEGLRIGSALSIDVLIS